MMASQYLQRKVPIRRQDKLKQLTKLSEYIVLLGRIETFNVVQRFGDRSSNFDIAR